MAALPEAAARLVLAAAVPLAAAAPRSAPAGRCASASDCYGLGDCVSGTCSCDPWASAAPDCSVFAVEPVDYAPAPGYRNASSPAWGGSFLPCAATALSAAPSPSDAVPSTDSATPTAGPATASSAPWTRRTSGSRSRPTSARR